MFLKIALTGVIVFIVCVCCILFDGRDAEYVPAWKVKLLAGGALAGLVAAIAGALGHIWTM